jgi:phosphoribosylaminoimidazole-succinocarboxamide synthase
MNRHHPHPEEGDVQPKYPISFDGAPHGLRFLYQGKTRETWTLPNWPFLLLMVTSQRLSTHNVVHKSLIPLKDQVLTALTIFWLTQVLQKIPHHLVAYGRRIYDYLPKSDYPADLHLHALITRRLEIILVEFIWRAYLAGSLWKKFYSKLREGMSEEEMRELDPYGLNLPLGLPYMHRFDTPIFTPTRKSEHDEPTLSQVLPDRLMVGQWPLKPLIGVRIPVGQQKSLLKNFLLTL